MLILLLILSLPVFAQNSDEFGLGRIDVVTRRPQVGEVDNGQVGSEVTKDDIQKHNRTNVGDALNLLSGVTMSTNPRNEKTIAIRGFDSRQVPLFIDGIPVYVPFDGYVDFNRFTTADLSSIQVSKGFTSMVYGPNTLGGAINLISRKPVKKLEFDTSMGVGSGDERRLATNLGTNQGLWYLQTGASFLSSEGFPLASDFKATPTEGGGQRDNSYRKDGKLSAKVGYTPKSGDEYALSYYIQNGEKGQPPTTLQDRVRYWQWPYWNKQSLYFVSQMAVTKSEILKVRLYQDLFDNKVNSYTDGTYRDIKPEGQGSISSGKSIYHDRTNGGSLTLESYRGQTHTLTFVGHYKDDVHREFDATGLKNSFYRDQLLTVGAEDSVKLGDKNTLSLGVSHYRLRPEEVFSRGSEYTLPKTQTANEWQAGLFHKLQQTSQLYATLASKTRMPTLKDRYSQRLGTFIENRDLRAERSLNLELGHKGHWGRSTQTELALFSSDIRDKIQEVANVQGTLSQVQNIDKVRIHGGEIGIKQTLTEKIELGGNYTYTYIKNLTDNETKVTNIPQHKFIANGSWRAHRDLSLIPFIEYNGRRWVSNTKEIPGFTVYNLKASYKTFDHATLEAGVNNLTDKNYALADGFPSPGRMYFINLNYEL